MKQKKFRLLKLWFAVFALLLGNVLGTLWVNRPVEATPIISPLGTRRIVAPKIERTPEEVIKYFFTDNYEEAIKVARCENRGLNQAAVNDNGSSTDHGIYQINSIHEKRFGSGFKTSVYENVRVAYLIYREQNWSPWYSSFSCHGL